MTVPDCQNIAKLGNLVKGNLTKTKVTYNFNETTSY